MTVVVGATTVFYFFSFFFVLCLPAPLGARFSGLVVAAYFFSICFQF